MKTELAKEIETVINRHSAENGSDTPDFILAHYLMQCLDAFDEAVCWREQCILAHYLMQCLDAFDEAVCWREQWYGREPRAIGNLTNPPEKKP